MLTTEYVCGLLFASTSITTVLGNKKYLVQQGFFKNKLHPKLVKLLSQPSASNVVNEVTEFYIMLKPEFGEYFATHIPNASFDKQLQWLSGYFDVKGYVGDDGSIGIYDSNQYLFGCITELLAKHFIVSHVKHVTKKPYLDVYINYYLLIIPKHSVEQLKLQGFSPRLLK